MAHFYPWLDYKYANFTDEMEQAGEVATHVFEVELNEAAKHFLKLEEFFSQDTIVQYPPLPPVEDEEEDLTDEDVFNEWAFRQTMERDDI